MAETEALLVDFEGDDEEYTFALKGYGDEFWDALDALKKAIPGRQRTYDPDDHLWTVKATPENEEALSRIFTNGKSCILTVKSQMMLF